MAPKAPGGDKLTDAFRLACKRAGITQEQLAEQLGVHQTTVSTWLLGKARPPLRHLPAIDALCGQPKGYVLRLAGYVEDVGIEGALAADPDLTPFGRQHLVATYRYMRDEFDEGPG